MSTTRMGDTLAEQRELARQTAEKIDRIESEMIAVGLARPDRTAAAAARPTAREAVSREPSAPAASRLDSMASPSAAQPGAEVPERAPLEFVAEPWDRGLPGAGQITVSVSSLPAQLEEAAILYANGQADPAVATLRQAIADGTLGTYTQQAWLMLFDVLRGTGQREAFDELSLEFASRLEKSPPPWRDSGRADAPAKALANSPVIAFPPGLDADCTRLLDQARRSAANRRVVTLDFAAVRTVDDEGASALLALIGEFRAALRPLVIAGAPRLCDAVRGTLEVGVPGAAPARWMLALEMLRVQGLRQQFDDLAIDYCVTFEVSPPSWEPMPACIRTDLASPAVQGHETEAASAPVGAFRLQGDVVGRIQKEIAALRASAHQRHDVLIDCRDLVRLDFIAAGELLNEIVTLRGIGKSVVFIEPDFIVIALMQVMGIHELADIRARRI